jgi:alpha-beta hydrolase superfamily lysophospholipase
VEQAGSTDSNDSTLTMADGQRLQLRDWPRTKARGAVLIVHGLGEHSGRYQRLAQWFNVRGYSVRGYDQRGHGLSPGPRGALMHPDDLLEDLATVYTDYANAQATEPLLLGHSMGGLVAVRAMLDQRITPPALVLSSPALRSREPAWLRRLVGRLAAVTPNLPMRSGLKADKLSHDPNLAAAYLGDPLCMGWITPLLADFIFRAGDSAIADAARLAVPTLLLVAGQDELVDPSGSHDFSTAAGATGKLTTRIFCSLYHELFNEAEPGRGQVLMQLGDWLGRDPGV